MAAFFKRKQEEEYVEDSSEDYLSISELDTKTSTEEKIVDVRVFVLDDYENIRDILDIIRGEKTICLIDIHLLRNKDPDELRRAIDKLKKTVNAVNGELVGFHENWVMASPNKVHIHKGKE
ncbi:MAG: cell division protein SepF [Nanoarchaeota archaeon]|nr:cell division protein SepF [Nanoarchaeota archaeon]